MSSRILTLSAIGAVASIAAATVLPMSQGDGQTPDGAEPTPVVGSLDPDGAPALVGSDGRPARADRPAPSTGPVLATPEARRAAVDAGVDLRSVRASGDGGWITEGDVAAFIAAQPRLPVRPRGGVAPVVAAPPRNAQDPRPTVKPEPASQDPWMLGDLHVHVSPPDEPGHSTLTVAKAIQSARRGGLDFVILTPHQADRSFPASPLTGGNPMNGQELVERLAEQHLGGASPDGSARDLVVVAGWEYTREAPGHLGVSFVDLASISSAYGDMKTEKALAAGAFVVINHPFFRPVKSDLAIMRLVSGDRRWKPFSGVGEDAGLWNAIEVWHDRSVWIEKLHAKSGERFPDTQMVQQALASWDVATLTEQRRITAVGGSDAHGRLPYTVAPMPVVSVRVETRDKEGLRRALIGARVTFGRGGGIAARDFAATSDVAGEEAGIGDSIRAKSEVRLRWKGSAVLIENGMRVGTFENGVTRELDTPGGFAFWRIEKSGDAYSNMIYANLPPR